MDSRTGALLGGAVVALLVLRDHPLMLIGALALIWVLAW